MFQDNPTHPGLFALSEAETGPILDLGGTMGPRKPSSSIDPNLFLGRPDYSNIWLGEAESHRCALERLRGKGPHTWVAEALGNETFAGKVIFTQRDCRVAARSKGRPLASNGNIYRSKQSGEFAHLIKDCAIQPGPVLRFAPHGRTSIRSGSITRVKIYQAHQHDPDLLAAEIKRVCLPGGSVMLLGIEMGMALDDQGIEAAMGSLLDGLAPIRSRGEHLLRREFRGFPLALEDSQYLFTGKLRTDTLTKPQFAVTKWNFFQLVAFLRTFPCVQRAEWQPTRVHAKSITHTERCFRFWSDLDALKNAWGRPQKVRLLHWPVYLRSGYLPS